MSALGHKQTFCDAAGMSALPPKADIDWSASQCPPSANSGHSRVWLSQKEKPGTLPGALLDNRISYGGARRQPLFFIGRQMVLGFFLGLELQKLLMGCLSGTFIYEFLKSHKVLSVYESIKILLVRQPLHVRSS
jgi:hypothetical protein